MILSILMFLAWAIGGEYRFGKGARGFLLAIPMTIYGLFVGVPIIGLAAQVGLLYCIYQALKYDPGIALAYSNPDPVAKIQGWAIIALNGALIGLTPAILFIASGHGWRILYSVVIMSLWFCFVVRLSNDDKFAAYRAFMTKYGPQSLPYKDDKGNAGFYINFKDAWWTSEGLTGLALGMIIIWLR